MPYPRGHRAQTRKQIVESARRMFNLHGFENVSIDAIMADAGLTRGGFYGYFKSKSDLYIEALGCFFTDPNWKGRWEGIDIDLASSDSGPQIVRATSCITHPRRTFRWPRIRRNRDPWNHQRRERFLPFRKSAVFTTAMSGAQPE